MKLFKKFHRIQTKVVETRFSFQSAVQGVARAASETWSESGLRAPDPLCMKRIFIKLQFQTVLYLYNRLGLYTSTLCVCTSCFNFFIFDCTLAAMCLILCYEVSYTKSKHLHNITSKENFIKIKVHSVLSPVIYFTTQFENTRYPVVPNLIGQHADQFGYLQFGTKMFYYLQNASV